MASLAIGRASDPVAKVLETLSGLLANIVTEAGGVTMMHDEFAEWCEDKSRNSASRSELGRAKWTSSKLIS